MFKPNESQDRTSYRDLLVPPGGYQLEKAVGTTYSLDLHALTAILMCLKFSAEMDSKLMKSPVALLHALEQISDKVLIFCEAGQISVPSSPSVLFLSLEKMIIPVALPKSRTGRYPVFHPKTWLLAFINAEGKKKYRFVVLSKNLTFDRSWDVSFAMESSEKAKQTHKTKPILDFLDFLQSQAASAKKDEEQRSQILSSFRSELKQVSFALESEAFNEDFEIMPMGIGAKSYPIKKDKLFCRDTDSKDYPFHALVIVSPFLSGSVIEAFNQKERGLSGCTRTLITRKSELSRLKKTQIDQFNVYTLKNGIVDGEDYLSDEDSIKDSIKRKQDIHAKLYLRRKETMVDLYLGSMNASFSALNQNVELMVRLGTEDKFFNEKKLLNELFCGSAEEEDNPFEPVSLVSAEEDTLCSEENFLRQKIKDLCRKKMQAVIEPAESMYRIVLQVSEAVPDKCITISPFYSNKRKFLNKQMVFSHMDILQLSEFYLVCARTRETRISQIIMIPTIGIPDGRERAVVNAVIKDSTAFAEYISLVLGEDSLLSLLEGKKIRESRLLGQTKQIMPALYEKMLRTALEEPKRLKEVQDVIKMIDDPAIIPDVFRETYKTFCRALKIT